MLAQQPGFLVQRTARFSPQLLELKRDLVSRRGHRTAQELVDAVLVEERRAAIATGFPQYWRRAGGYRLDRDPDVPISDVQWVLGHQSLATTQIYVVPTAEEVIESTLAHHRRQAEPKPAPPEPERGPRYRPESLDVLFGKGRW